MKKIIKLILLSSLITATGCMKAKSSVEDSSQKAAEAIGCTDFKSKVFDSMYDYLDTEKAAPDLEDFNSSLNNKIDLIVEKQKINNPEVLNKLKKETSELYKILIEKSAELKQTKTSKEHLQTIIELEMEDQSSEENVQLNNVTAKQFAKIESIATELDVECAGNPTDGIPVVSTPSVPEAPLEAASKLGVLIGSHNVMATAYQSCQSLEISDLTAGTPAVGGIEIFGTHPDGIGSKRRIASVNDVQDSHPYIKVSGGAQAGCFNVRSNPLIYDYGGEPSISNNVIDLSKDSGTGTSVLGVDCSAYVSAAIAAGGLRYKPGVENKAVFIRQNSTKFINAKSSGFSCFNNAPMTSNVSLVTGDIIGVRGHVLMIDKIGSDPFGLKRLKSVSDCGSLDVNYFDFTVIQSSPSKNGIGINKYVARDYLKESSKMYTAFMGIGKAACQAYFNGVNVTTPSTDYGILRHNGSVNCISPKIKIANQSCVSQCLQ